MINQDMMRLGNHRSVIRDIFEYGRQRAKEVGKENIFDFSLGNPNVPAPAKVAQTLEKLAKMDPVAVHGYTSAQGSEVCRKAMADDLNHRFGTNYRPENFYMTCGAAASLMITLRALVASSVDEVIVFAPFFPEYKMWVESCGGAKCVIIPAQIEDFQIDFATLEASINENTKALIVNSPNNPCGVIYSEETISRLAALLKKKSAQYGHPIYLISDEPYREIVYGGEKIRFIASAYCNTVVCYSFSKSLSLPGERIGYILVPDCIENAADVYAAVCGAGRSFGYVCAPSMFQMVAAECVGTTSNTSIYETNRKLLLDGLRSFGYTCVAPGGAFYLFPRSLEADATAFCKKAMKYDLLLVPGDSFGTTEHFRLAYCVRTETVERALPVFKKLAEDYGIR